MPPKALPPPPRPDPVTLDQIYNTLTTPTLPLDEKAYQLVALSTVAFHPSVKLFLFEEPNLSTPATTSTTTTTAADASTPANEQRNKQRRETLLKNIAFFLAQRNNAVCEECRWETVSLLGELCRMDNGHAPHGKASSTGANSTNTSSNNVPSTPPPATPQAQLDAKLNLYAKQNLEYLATLPWFLPAVNALITAGDKEEGAKTASAAATGAAGASSSSSAKGGAQGTASSAATAEAKLSREELKQRLREKQNSNRNSMDGFVPPADESAEPDEDVIIALKDILNALPTVETDANNTRTCVWTPEALAQAHDLMFLDASTNLLHLIPTVSRCYSNVCGMCRKVAPADKTSTKFLRCSSCKAVYYCSADCQKKHWSLSHRQPCTTFKDRCNVILEEYYALNKHKHNNKNNKNAADAAVAVLEVPLEPSLFYETRRYLFDHKDSSFGNVNFYDYFMKYNVRGS